MDTSTFIHSNFEYLFYLKAVGCKTIITNFIVMYIFDLMSISVWQLLFIVLDDYI